MISIKIQKKDLWLLAAIMVFLIGVAYVIAYNPGGAGGNPAIMGHSADEIEGVCLSDGTNCPKISIDYSTCVTRLIGKPTGDHTCYCPEGYIVVGGATDGNDWTWETVVCCKLEGIVTKNWGSKPLWGVFSCA